MDASTLSNISAGSRKDGAVARGSEASAVSASRWFLILSAVHLLVWTMVAILTQPNAPLDVVEMVYWGNEWQWGYYKHPPLPAWIAAAATGSFGGRFWPLYLVSQTFIISCFWVCWRMARAVLEPWAALAAVAVLEFCLFYNYASPEFNNNIPPKLFWALSTVFLYFALSRDSATSNERTEAIARGTVDWKSIALWAGTGTSIALSMLSKYDAAILVVSLLVFTAVHPRGRSAWKTSGPWICTLIAGVVFLPHAVWLWQNDFPTLQYFGHRSTAASSWIQHLTNPLEFIASQTLSLAGVLIVLAMLFGWRMEWRSLTAQQRFARNYLAFAVLGPLLLAVTFSLISGGKMKSSWGASMWTFLPLLLLLSFRVEADRNALRRLVRSAIVASCLVAVAFAARNIAGPYLRSKPSRVHFPGSQLAATVQRMWGERNSEPLRAVGGDSWYAGNVAAYATEVSNYIDLDPEHAPWIDDQELRRFGGVILWSVDDERTASEMPDSWKRRFPDAHSSTTIVLPWQTAAHLEPLRVGIAIVDPMATGYVAKNTDAMNDRSEKQR